MLHKLCIFKLKCPQNFQSKSSNKSELQFEKNFEKQIQISDPLFVLMVKMSRDRLETLPAIIVYAVNSDSRVIKFPLPKEILLMKSGIIKSIFE